MILHKQIKCQRQQSCVLVFLAISGHEKQQKNNQKILGIKVLWKQLLQKIPNTQRFLPFYRSGRCRTGRWRSSDRWFRCAGKGLGLWGLFSYRHRYGTLRWRIPNAVSPVRSIRLGNVAVIHGITSYAEAEVRRH